MHVGDVAGCFGSLTEPHVRSFCRGTAGIRLVSEV